MVLVAPVADPDLAEAMAASAAVRWAVLGALVALVDVALDAAVEVDSSAVADRTALDLAALMVRMAQWVCTAWGPAGCLDLMAWDLAASARIDPMVADPASLAADSLAWDLLVGSVAVATADPAAESFPDPTTATAIVPSQRPDPDSFADAATGLLCTGGGKPRTKNVTKNKPTATVVGYFLEQKSLAAIPIN